MRGEYVIFKLETGRVTFGADNIITYILHDEGVYIVTLLQTTEYL